MFNGAAFTRVVASGQERNLAMTKHAKHIGLALGSGGARGWAHLGVLRALRELGVPVHCVAGTSMGALVGAALAADRVEALEEVALKVDWKRMIYYLCELSFPRLGLIDGGRIEEFIGEHVGELDIRQLKLPYAAVATDICTGEEIVMTEGSVMEAVRASIAIPGMFTPLKRDNLLLVDGGLVNPLPVDVTTRLGAQRVIAVDITRDPVGPSEDTGQNTFSEEEDEHDGPLAEDDPVKRLLARFRDTIHGFDLKRFAAEHGWFGKRNELNIFDIYGNTVRIIERQITLIRLKLDPPDVLIQPHVKHIGTMDFHKSREAIDAGYEATMAQQGAIEKMS